MKRSLLQNPLSMKRSLFGRLPLLAVSVLAAATAVSSFSSAENSSSPRFSPEQASRILTLRNVGLAQLEEERPKEARSTFAKLADAVPGEALPLANGAIAALREKDLPGAEALLGKALALGGSGGRSCDSRGPRERAKPARRRPRRSREGRVPRPSRPRVALAVRAKRGDGPVRVAGRKGRAPRAPCRDRRPLALEPARAPEAPRPRRRGGRRRRAVEGPRGAGPARLGRRRARASVSRRRPGRSSAAATSRARPSRSASSRTSCA